MAMHTRNMVSVVPLNSIEEGLRFRQDYGDMTELVESIRANGLIHPIAVAHNDPEGDPNKPYKLLAGGRRFRACVTGGFDPIPVRIYPLVLTERELRCIELEENIRRKELSVVEALKLKQEIHNLQVSIHGPKVSNMPNAPGHSIRDTAKLLGEDHSTTVNDLKLAKAMDSFPDMGWDKCKTKNDAHKILSQLSTLVDRKLKGDDAQATIGRSANKQAKLLLDSYLIGDFIKFCQQTPTNTYNFIEIDPPYGIELQSIKQNYDNSYSAYGEVKPSEYQAWLEQAFIELYRILAPNSWLVCWFAPEPWFETVYQAITKAGFRTKRMCGIWNKPNGQSNQPEYNLGNAYEMFFYAAKGQPKLSKPGRLNTFNFSPEPPDSKYHPTQRPIELSRELLKTFAEPNSRVFVPCCGSGTTLIAAVLENMIPVGIDLLNDFKPAYSDRVRKQFLPE